MELMPDDDLISSDQEPSARRRRQREPVKPLPDYTQLLADLKTEEEKQATANELLGLANEIWNLVELKRKNHGKLPPRVRKPEAARLGLSEDKLDRLIKKMDNLDLARKARESSGPRVGAVIQGSSGRQKGKRRHGSEVDNFIIDAWRNPDWESLNHLNLTDLIHNHLNRQMIWKLAKAKFPHLNISSSYVWRVIHDFEESNPAQSALARGRGDEVRDNILSLEVDFGDPNNIWIWDIRPLPFRSKYKDHICTVGILYGMDASSTKVLRYKLLPRQDADEHGNLFGIDFTCQHVREQIVLAILEAERRPRCIYVDNGAQFGKALEKFLDLLTAEGEEPTIIIHTEPDEPRGRGLLERALGLIDDFIQYKPNFIDENNYRKSLKNKKKYKFYELSFLEGEFDKFIPIRNKKVKNGNPSPNERYNRAPNVGLMPPSSLQLALFGGKVEKISDRTPSRNGVRYKNQHYDPVSSDPQIGVLLAGASIARQKKPALLAHVGDLTILYAKLDGKKWEPFLQHGKRKWSAQRQKEWKAAVKQHITSEQKVSVERLQLSLLDDLESKLVIDPFEQEFAWKHKNNTDNTTNDPPDGVKESDETDTTEHKKDLTNGSSGKTVQTNSGKGRRNNSGQTTGNVENKPIHQDALQDDDGDEDDVPNFIMQRMQKLNANNNAKE